MFSLQIKKDKGIMSKIIFQKKWPSCIDLKVECAENIIYSYARRPDGAQIFR
jgi:hypothetical protein